MAKRTSDVRLRLWTPRGATIDFVKQVSPTIDDLTDRGVRVDERTVDFPTGSWGDEERDYHVHLVVPAQEVGAEMLAGRVGLVVDGEVVTRSLVRAVWTDDGRGHPDQPPSRPLHRAGRAGVGDRRWPRRSRRGRRAHRDDPARVAPPSSPSNPVTRRRCALLAGVVDIVEASTGTVRLRRDVDAADEMALDTRSTRTVRTTAE